VAQGIAQALFEEAVYDEGGNLITGSFAEYLLPSAADLPRFVTDRTETPATTHPLGTKGVGEAGTIASTPAVVNAIVDALRHKGVHDVPMPCTPSGCGVPPTVLLAVLSAVPSVVRVPAPASVTRR